MSRAPDILEKARELANTTKSKPLFIPLMGTYYDAFADGSKKEEYRPLGPRWNHGTCTIGREVVLSRGYGKKSRMNKKISRTVITNNPPEDFVKIYGKEKLCLIIGLE